MDASLLKKYLTGSIDGLTINESFLLSAGILMEIPIAMVLLSKILPKQTNCLANMGAASVKTTVMAGTLFIGSSTKYYLFFAVIEIATTVFILGYTLRWWKQKEKLA